MKFLFLPLFFLFMSLIGCSTQESLSDSNGSSVVGQIATGDQHSCIMKDSLLYCWGNNEKGQLGIDEERNYQYFSPTKAVVLEEDSDEPLNNIKSFEAGGSHTCALLSHKQIKCWGDNEKGQLGVSFSSETEQQAPVTVEKSSTEDLENVIEMALGFQHTCALVEEDTTDDETKKAVYCWGDNSYKQLGVDNSSTTKTHIPQKALEEDDTLIAIEGLFAGSNHNCVLVKEKDNASDSDSEATTQLKCWGGNQFGQLGQDSTTVSSAHELQDPVLVEDPEGTLIKIESVITGGLHNCALVKEKDSASDPDSEATTQLKCWGANHFGQLGQDSTTVSAHEPQDTLAEDPEGTLIKIESVTAGGQHNCALVKEKDSANDPDSEATTQLKCWGGNQLGQLGDGGVTNRHTLSDVLAEANSPLEGVTSVSLGKAHTCGLSHNQLKCWGDNEKGQLGDGSNSPTSFYPVNVNLP